MTDKTKKIDFEEEIDMEDLLSALYEKLSDTDNLDFNDYVALNATVKDRNIDIGGISSNTGRYIDSLIRFWNRQDEGIPAEERKPIKLYIDSYGGSLTDCFTIINAIKMSKTPIYTIAIGCAYSAGFFIFICGHKRFAYPLASFLYHEGSAANNGTAGQFRNFSAFYDKQLNQLKKIIIENTNWTEETYKEIIKDDVWMTAEEAQEKGCVDEIITELI